MIHFRYIMGAFLALPLLPIMAYQGKRIRKLVPRLGEAKNPAGSVIIKNQKSLSVLAIGESTIAGVGVTSHEEGFTGSFAQKLSEALDCSVRWRVYAKSGYTARQVTERLLPKIKEKQADLILIGLGGNNAFKLQNPLAWKSEIQQLIHVLSEKFPKTPIVFLNMPPIRDFPAFTPLIKMVIGQVSDWLGEELKKVANAYEHVYFYSEIIRLEDWLQILEGKSQDDFFSDGVHPSPLTYQTWAKEMVEFALKIPGLKQMLLSRQ